MPLRSCPDCAKEVSDRAQQCIHCGCPLQIASVSDSAPREVQAAAGVSANSPSVSGRKAEVDKTIGKESDILQGQVAKAAVIVYGVLTTFSIVVAVAARDLQIFGGFFAVIFGIYFIVTLVHYLTTSFLLTSRRVIAKAGFIFTQSCDIKLSKVESVQVSRGLFGMIFNYGTVTIRGTGGVENGFPYMDKPEQMRVAVSKAIDSHEDRGL